MLVADLNTIAAAKQPGFAPEMLSKARHAAAACNAGVQRVHIINGRVDEGLLAEVFSNEGIGTLIYANEYQQIRRRQEKGHARHPGADQRSRWKPRNWSSARGR